MKKRLTIDLMLPDNFNLELKISHWPQCDDIYYEYRDTDIDGSDIPNDVLLEEITKLVDEVVGEEVMKDEETKTS